MKDINSYQAASFMVRASVDHDQSRRYQIGRTTTNWNGIRWLLHGITLIQEPVSIGHIDEIQTEKSDIRH